MGRVWHALGTKYCIFTHGDNLWSLAQAFIPFWGYYFGLRGEKKGGRVMASGFFCSVPGMDPGGVAALA